MDIYDSLISQTKNQLMEQVNKKIKNGNSSFDDMFDSLKNTLDDASKMTEKFKGTEAADAFSKMIDDAKTKLNEIESEGDNNEFADTLKKLSEQAKKDEEMFKTFDFMQLMTQLMYGTNDEDERNQLYKKMQDLADSVK